MPSIVNFGLNDVSGEPTPSPITAMLSPPPLADAFMRKYRTLER